MKLIVFNPYFAAMNERILTVVKRFTQCSAAFADSRPEFETELMSSLSGETIVAFFIGRYRDLLFLEEMHQQFVDVKLLINLHSRLEMYEKRARKLRPRFLSYRGDCCCRPEAACSCLMPQFIRGILKETAGRKERWPNILQ